MAKTIEKAAEQINASAEPIGTPPSGGNWTWDIPSQQWVEVAEQAAE